MPAKTRLYVIGGGPRHVSVLTPMISYAADSAGYSKILIVPWADEITTETGDYMTGELLSAGATDLFLAPPRSEMGLRRDEFLQQVDRADAVYFTGGDQNYIMQVVHGLQLGPALTKAYENGVLFAGTSAGTAVMSELMITGRGDFQTVAQSKVEIDAGLAFLQRVVLDQHFLVRKRMNRLMSVVLAHRNVVGLGIDESTAVYVADGNNAKVYGRSQVALLSPHPSDRSVQVAFYQEGDEFKLP